MKAVILAGGMGTRLSEETVVKPKPMVEIGGMPILWHIMKHYAKYDVNDFVICLGYKGYMIKEYFANYFRHMSDVTFDLANNKETYHNNRSEKWRVTLVDTGNDTMTGGRIKRIKNYVKDEKAFCLTYGDGLSDININSLIKFHEGHKKTATMTVIQPPGRFGSVQMNGDTVKRFTEKPQNEGGYINGGFFVLSPKALDTIEGDQSIWERAPLEKLASDGELMAYKYDGFWQCMDTLRDKSHLEELWESGRAPWKVW